MGLRFEHLVSKIVIDRVTRIYSDGSTNSDIWKTLRTISFPNMPTLGTFATGINTDESPRVEFTDEKRGVRFHFADYIPYFNKEQNIPLYVFPQSFNDENNRGRFLISLTDGNVYEGDLKELVNEFDKDHKLTDIKAGECLTIRLVLKDNEVEGFYVYIQNWNTETAGQVKDKPYPSVGTPEELIHGYTELDGNRFQLNFSDDLVYEEKDGIKTVRLSDNIDLTGLSNLVLVIPEGYVLDGCDFNITCSGLTFEGDVRNLYINGENIY